MKQRQDVAICTKPDPEYLTKCGDSLRAFLRKLKKINPIESIHNELDVSIKVLEEKDIQLLNLYADADILNSICDSKYFQKRELKHPFKIITLLSDDEFEKIFHNTRRTDEYSSIFSPTKVNGKKYFTFVVLDLIVKEHPELSAFCDCVKKIIQSK